jgi:two-component system, chemotaxis family, protein-glutamate methylesterase/glutaminase
MAGAIRILVCDDSATYAHGLTQFLRAEPGFEVVGVCASGEEALDAVLRLDPDLVTMDLEMPGMGGVRAVGQIMRRRPVPILVLSGHAGRGSELAARALAAGALEVLSKDHLRFHDAGGLSAVTLRQKLRRLSGARVGLIEHSPAHAVVPARPLGATVIGICASTGGPRALEAVLRALPADFPVPIVVVQHMAAGFIDGLVDWLDGQVALPVGLARRGQELEAGVWFAPDGAQARIGPSLMVSLDTRADSALHRPSGDALLESMAGSAGPGAVGVVLTGMGRDGAAGVAALKGSGGYVIAQDEGTSAVFGMPRAAADAGADLVLSLSQIGNALIALGAVEARA